MVTGYLDRISQMRYYGSERIVYSYTMGDNGGDLHGSLYTSDEYNMCRSLGGYRWLSRCYSKA